MDYQEAIETLKRNKPTSDPRRCGKEQCEACDVAISAMQELQEYKQLGTLEDLKKLKERELSGVELAKIACNLNLLEKYKQLGDLEEVREAVEKQKKKKPIEDRHHGIRYTEVYRCHSCNESFSGRGFAKYCYHCGQAIEWNEDE